MNVNQDRPSNNVCVCKGHINQQYWVAVDSGETLVSTDKRVSAGGVQFGGFTTYNSDHAKDETKTKSQTPGGEGYRMQNMFSSLSK